VDLSLVWCLDLAHIVLSGHLVFSAQVIAEVLGDMSVSKVYIGNLAEDARDRDIEKLFKGYGRVRNIVVKNDGGYGFAEFDDREDAKDAVKDLDGSSFMGSRLRIEHARDSRDSRRDGGRWSPPRGRFSRGNPPGRRTGYRTIVENLSSRTSWQDLKDFMRKAGEITYTNTNQPRVGEGIVEFGSRRDMEYALDKLDGEELDGRRIRLVEEGGGRRSRSRSRSRSRTRSRSRSRDRRRSSRDRSPSSAKSESRSRSRSRSRRRRTRSRS